MWMFMVISMCELDGYLDSPPGIFRCVVGIDAVHVLMFDLTWSREFVIVFCYDVMLCNVTRCYNV